MARRFYTPELAKRSLPLVSAIAGDIQETAQKIRQIWLEPKDGEGGSRDSASEERLVELRKRFSELVSELDTLGVELKDPLSGLLDFRAQRWDEEVYLCWRLGEDSVDHWHTLDGGFAGRRPMAEFYESSASGHS